MPYGMEKNENNEWFVFNREYLPLGCNEQARRSEEPCRPIYTAYKGLTDDKLIEIVRDNTVILKNDRLHKVFFYRDGTNPTRNNKNRRDYEQILEELSVFRAIPAKK